MSDPTFGVGDTVHTPSHAEATVVTVNRGPPRGRMWREVSYTVETGSLRGASSITKPT
jgi:hypothetical protein